MYNTNAILFKPESCFCSVELFIWLFKYIHCDWANRAGVTRLCCDRIWCNENVTLNVVTETDKYNICSQSIITLTDMTYGC